MHVRHAQPVSILRLTAFDRGRCASLTVKRADVRKNFFQKRNFGLNLCFLESTSTAVLGFFGLIQIPSEDKTGIQEGVITLTQEGAGN